MKIHEHFMFGGEFNLLNFRASLKYVDFLYSSSLTYLDKTHAGNKLNWDSKQLKKYINIKKFEINSEDAKNIYYQHIAMYEKYNVEWEYEIGQRLVGYILLKNHFDEIGYPDLLIISDCDEIPLDINISKIEKINSNFFRLGMDWRIGDPRFKYDSLWPGSMVIKGCNQIEKLLNDPRLPLLIHQTRDYEYIEYNCGFHLTYFGGHREFKEKCKRIAERKSKRVILSSIIGPWLLKNRIDPMLRFHLKINRIASDQRFIMLENNDWD